MELLIAIALLAIVTAVITTGFGLSIRVWEAGDKRITNHYAVTEAIHLISRQLKSARQVYTLDELSVQSGVAFRGDSSSIAFVSELPAFHSPGEAKGPFLQKVTFDAAGKKLVFKEAPFFPHSPMEGDFEGLEIVMGEGKITSFDVQYYIKNPLVHESERGSELYSWVDTVNMGGGSSSLFEDEQTKIFTFPEAVKIKITVKSKDTKFVWPELILPLYAGSEAKKPENLGL